MSRPFIFGGTVTPTILPSATMIIDAANASETSLV